jgi:hypothetical protein
MRRLGVVLNLFIQIRALGRSPQDWSSTAQLKGSHSTFITNGYIGVNVGALPAQELRNPTVLRERLVGRAEKDKISVVIEVVSLSVGE